MKLWMKPFGPVRAGRMQNSKIKHKCNLSHRFEKRRNTLTKELHGKEKTEQQPRTCRLSSLRVPFYQSRVLYSLRQGSLDYVHTVYIMSCCIYYVRAVFISCILSSLRAYCLCYVVMSSICLSCLHYVHTVFITCILSILRHAVFTMCVQSLFHAYCLHYVHIVFVTQCCLCYVHTVFVTWRCFRYVHTVFVTCILSLLRAYCLY